MQWWHAAPTGVDAFGDARLRNRDSFNRVADAERADINVLSEPRPSFADRGDSLLAIFGVDELGAVHDTNDSCGRR